MPENDNTHQAVAYVANILEISDFDFFILSWREWHGSEPDRAVIEADFGQYLDHGTVPFYVSSYTRKILSDDDILTRERNAKVRAQFIYYVPLIIFFILFMYFLLK